MEETTIDLSEIIAVLKRRKKFILVIFLSCTIGAFLISLVIPSAYEAEALLLLKQPRETDNYLNASVPEHSPTGIRLPPDRDGEQIKRRLLTYQEIFKSRAVIQAVIDGREKAGNDSPQFGEFFKQPTVQVINGSESLTVKVTAHTPEEARDLTDELIQAFFNRLQELQFRDDTIQVIDQAVAPNQAIKPKIVVNMAIGALMGLLLGICVAFLLEFLNHRICTTTDVKKYLNLPVIGQIPFFQSKTGLIVKDDIQSQTAEEFRTLRTNIYFSGNERMPKTILFTSTGPQEGKSIIAANLAVSMAQDGRTVVLVDCDLRKPVQHQYFGIEQQGITNILSEDIEPLSLIQETPVENLRILASGPLPTNPSELLGSRKMTDLVKRLKDHADIVIMDAPSVSAITDVSILASKADVTLLVVAAESTKIEMARRACEILVRARGSVLGIVLNRMNDEENPYFSYYGVKEDICR